MILAACAENTTTPTARDASAGSASTNQYPEFNGPSANAHIMHTRQWFAQNPSDNTPGGSHGKPGGGGGSTSNGISYHGGPVLQAGTNVAAVYWASSAIYSGGPTPGSHGSGSSDGSLVGYFLSNLGGSPYFNINSTYTDGSSTPIANSVSYTQYWANNTSVPSNGQSVSDSQMIAMLQSGFDSGALTYDPGTLYIIFTAGTVNLGGGFGTQYCAYHTHGTVTVNGASKNVLYSAMPYTYAYPSACTNGTASPNNDPAADAEVNVVAHETEETTTDEMGNAWFDTRGYENADKCAWNFGTTQTNSNGVYNITVGAKQFLVQQNWVNANGGSCKQSWP